MRVALFRGRVDGKELHDPVGPPAPRLAEMPAGVGIHYEVAAVEAVAVQVDELVATRALAPPIPVVVVDHRPTAFACTAFMHLNVRTAE